eukprot:1885922-Rhodomonas_salina.4
MEKVCSARANRSSGSGSIGRVTARLDTISSKCQPGLRTAAALSLVLSLRLAPDSEVSECASASFVWPQRPKKESKSVDTLSPSPPPDAPLSRDSCREACREALHQPYWSARQADVEASRYLRYSCSSWSLRSSRPTVSGCIVSMRSILQNDFGSDTPSGVPSARDSAMMRPMSLVEQNIQAPR